jgi:DNA polymerase-1
MQTKINFNIPVTPQISGQAQKSRLFLVDGSALYYRSYFAFIRNPLINSKGENTSTTFGFLNIMLKLIEDEHPDYLAIIFDTREPTFRHEIYPEYKATREKMPEEMAAQYPRLISTLKAFNFNLLEQAGFEADDIIGSLARQYASSGLKVFIVSSDKDMAQLVNENVYLYHTPKGKENPEILDASGVRQKYEIAPEQIIDWLTLMGDKSDNIPGIPKVGEITAARLLQQYGSIENLYGNIHELKEGIVKTNLLQYRDITTLSRNLATIRTDMKLACTLEDLRFRIWESGVVKPLLDELEFRRLLDRVMNVARDSSPVPEFSKHSSDKAGYLLIDTMDKFQNFLSELSRQKEFVFDLETSSLDFLEAIIAGISFSWKEHHGYYVALRHPDSHTDPMKILQHLKAVFADAKILKIGQNIKFDAMILEQQGISVNGLFFDTMLASYLLNPGGQHNLDKLAEQYLNYEMIHIEELIGAGKKQKSMTDLPAQQVAVYSAEDADITWQLYRLFKTRISEAGMDELFYGLEMPLIQVLIAMERAGVALDVTLLKRMSGEISGQIAQLEKNVYEAVGRRFNMNSAQQLGVILFDQLEIHQALNRRKPAKTKTGHYSTTEKILERYVQHPLVSDLMAFRKLSKLKSTYVDALPELISPKSGKVHTSYNQAVAATGRLSSSNPNLQNIPIRTELGREIRKAFIPSEPGFVILSADYSQIELRLVAHLSGDETMRLSFREKADIHAATAALIFNVSLSDVSPDQRRKAKEINFGIIYGMSRYGLADRLNIPVDEAEMFIANYFATYPKVGQYMQTCIEQAREKGYVETMLLRRRYLPDINSSNRNLREFAERTAINTPIQGSAADMIKKAMINIQQLIVKDKLPARMLLQVHDELVFEVAAGITDDFSRSVRHIMEGALMLDVPMIVECGIGDNWLEAH